MILTSQNPTHNKDLKSQIDSKNTNSNRAVASCNDDKIDSKPLKNIDSIVTDSESNLDSKFSFYIDVFSFRKFAIFSASPCS